MVDDSVWTNDQKSENEAVDWKDVLAYIKCNKSLPVWRAVEQNYAADVQKRNVDLSVKE